MNKYFKSLIGALLLVISFILVSNSVVSEAATKVYYSGDYKYELNKDGTVNIVSYRGWDKDVVIPSKIDGKKVTKISSIDYVGYSSTSKITRITIPKTVTNIAEGVFRGCASLREIIIDSKNKHYISEDGVLFTKERDVLVSVMPIKKGTYVIPEGVTRIGNSAFANSVHLTEIVFSNSVKTIGSYAFSNCKNISNMIIPDSVESIGKGAFSDCKKLESIKLSENITTIADLTFSSSSSLKNIVLPDGVTSIGKTAFSNCDSLTSVTLGNGVKKIGENAFTFSNSLTYITIPSSVTNMNKAFERTKLEGIHVDKDNRIYSSVDGVLFTKDKTKLLVFPSEKTGEYTIPNTVTNIADHAFLNSTITKINISENVRTIGDHAFDGSGNLEEIIIPDNVTQIGHDSFRGCVNVKNVTLSKNMTEIPKWAFASCNSLSDVTIPEGVTKISYGAFARNNSLKSITIPKSVTSIDENIFDESSKFEAIYGENNSKAQKYANDNNVIFKLADGSTPVKVSKVKPNVTSLSLVRRKTFQVKVDATPTQATSKAVSYKSSNKEVVTVTRKGLIRGIKVGEATITITAKDGSNSKVTIKVTVKPTNLQNVVAAKKSSNSVKISWNRDYDATGYEVYRSTSKSGGYKKVKTITKSSTVSFVDTKLAKNKNYYYKVRSYTTVSGKKIYSNFSSYKKITL